MWDLNELKACAVCLRTRIKLHSMAVGNLRQDYNLVSGLKTRKEKGLPEYLCVECTAYVRNFKKFRDKCHRAHFTILELLNKNKEITVTLLDAFDTKCLNITPSLSYLQLENVHYETVKFKWLKKNRALLTTDHTIPIHHCSTIDNNVIYEVPIAKDKSVKEEVENHEQNEAPGDIHCHDVSDDFDMADPATEEEVPNNVEKTNETAETADIEMLLDTMFNMTDDKEADITNDDKANETEEQEASDNVDGSQLEEEYATMAALSVNEIKAVADIYKMFGQGKHKCSICSKCYHNEKRLMVHMRMHDTHTSGTFYCSLCSYYYRSEFLLKTHVSDKHMYKYICKKCPEVSYDKTSAKQHFIWTHLQKGKQRNSNWYDADNRPSWLSNRGGKRSKGVLSLRPVRKSNKVPKDFPKQSAVPQEEQYEMIQERKKSRNYQESTYKCHLCYRGFREMSTYGKHMKKHDPVHSGELQCDMCKLHFDNTRKMYKHMRVCHTYKYSCQLCTYVCYNRSSALTHYKFHKNVTFKCPHCDMVFNKMSTRLTHIRVKHPSTIVCELCGHSFVSDTGLYFHKKIAHTKEEIEACENAKVDTTSELYCAECRIQFRSTEAFSTHFGSSSKHAQTNVSSKPIRTRASGRTARRSRGWAKDIVNNGMVTANDCELCGETLPNDVAARKHYESAHPGADFLKRYMCDICGHVTKQYANLLVHMRTHTQEKPYSCPHCDRKFSMISNRDRHLVVHTGEKRYQCQHCSRRFTQRGAVKLHIQTVHLKIPYAPWDKKNRKRRKELEGAAPLSLPAPHKYFGEPQGDYLNAYINYNDE